MTNNFLEIFRENPIKIKWTIIPKITAKARSLEITHVRTNTVSDGTVIITAITVPFNKISYFVSFRGFLSSDNN